MRTAGFIQKSRKKRGLAIIITLMVLSLLLALISAFLTINRAGNKFTVGSLDRRLAQDAALTAFSFAWFNLEQSRDWGTQASPISGSDQFPGTNPTVKMTKSQNGDTGIVDGAYSPSGNFDEPVGTFRMEIKNNLQSRDALPGLVPSRAVNINVEVTVGGVTRNLDAILKPKPQSHESLAAGGNINLDDTSGLLRIASKDPYVNRIAAVGDLNLPFNDDVQFLKHGVAASGGELNVGGTDLAAVSDSQLRAAGDTSGGTYLPPPGSGTLQVDEFLGDELALPNNVENIPGGNWVFGSINRHEYKAANIQYSEDQGYDAFGNKRPNKEGNIQRHQKRSHLYNVLTAPNGQRWAAGTAIPGESSDWDPPDSAIVTQSSESAAANWGHDYSAGGFGTDEANLPTSDVHVIAPGFEANVVTAQFAIHSGYRMVANGDFVVTGEGDRSPELYFGYDLTDGGVAQQESLNEGLEEAQNRPAEFMGALVATGDLNVTGGVLGYGSMIAGGDLTIKASSGLRTAPGLGVVVKGQNVIVNPSTEPEPGLPGEPINVDYPIFRDAIQAESGGNWSQYDNWLDHQLDTRNAVINSLGSTSAGATAASLWGTLNTEIGDGGPFPAADLSGWPVGNITINQYVRLKEFYQTVSTGYNGGDGDIRWLDLNDRIEDADGRVAAVLDGAAYWAKSYKKSVQEYLTSPDPGLPEMYMEGLIYAEQDIIFNATGKSVKLEGAVVARNGSITINGASKIDLVYDRELLDDLLGSNGLDGATLEKVFFVID